MWTALRALNIKHSHSRSIQLSAGAFAAVVLLWLPSCATTDPAASEEGVGRPTSADTGGARSLQEPAVDPAYGGPPIPGATVGGSDVSGGGPLGAGDAEAARRIQSLLPDFQSVEEKTNADALAYIGGLVRQIPNLNPYFGALATGADCAIRHGIAAARAYIQEDLNAVSAMVIVSNSQAGDFGRIAADCFLEEVFGGGPTTGFDPCFKKYKFDAAFGADVDTYYVATASTANLCDTLASAHTMFSPTAW